MCEERTAVVVENKCTGKPNVINKEKIKRPNNGLFHL